VGLRLRRHSQRRFHRFRSAERGIARPSGCVPNRRKLTCRLIIDPGLPSTTRFQTFYASSPREVWADSYQFRCGWQRLGFGPPPHAQRKRILTRVGQRVCLVLMVRESPLSLIHLRNMVSVTEAGATVCPPTPAFYLRPQSVNDIVDFSVARALDLLDVPHTIAARWQGQGG
jgi:hypothetical protein